MDGSMTWVLATLGGVLCLVSVGLIVLVARHSMRDKKKPAASAPATTRSIAPPQPAPRPAPEPTSPLATGNLPVDAGYDEEEMPTVVVSRPPTDRPSPVPRTPPRSSGATIIAFDDEEEED